MFTTIYHKINGAQVMYTTDANDALARFPLEWSKDPWPEAAAEPAAADPVVPITDPATARAK